MTVEQLLAIAVFSGAYVLIATEFVHRTAAALGGAAVMLGVGLIDGDTAYYSHDSGIDWNVIFLLLGMMVIVGVVKLTGLFEYLAITAVQRARGRPFLVMTLLVVLTAVASALLDNVTVVLLVAPVTFMVCRRLDMAVAPFLIAEVMASNIGGTATLIGDPPNIIIASRGGLTFNDFLVNLAPFVVVMLVVFVGLCWLLFRRQLSVDPALVREMMADSAKDAIRDGRLLWQSLAVLLLVLLGFVFHAALGFEPSVVALLGAGLLVLISSATTRDAIDAVEWETLVFFMGLFVMVGALVQTGVIDKVAEGLTSATGGDLWLTVVVIVLGSLVISGLVDNIPYVAAMSPVVASLVEAGGADHVVLWWALALGADLGGNASAVGASANVVAIGLAERNGTPISFWQFTKYGIVVAAVSGALALPYLWFRYF